MKKYVWLFFVPMLAMADPQESKVIDFSYQTAPALKVYQANQKTYQWTVKNNNTAVNGTGYTPFMYIAASNRAVGVVTAACTWVTQTAGVFNAVFSPTMLNTNGAWIYGVGLTSNNVTVARQADFTIIPDPYATGAGTLTFSYGINWSLYTFTNTATYGPYLAGSNIALRAGGTNGSYYIDANSGAITSGLATVAYVDAATNGRVAQANYAETANNSSNLAGLAGSLYITNGANVSALVNDANYVTASVTNGILTAAKDYTDSATNGAYASAKSYTDSATNGAYSSAKAYTDTVTNNLNVFNGPGSNGVASSTTADTNSLLRGDGRWTPMMFVTNDATAGFDNIVCGDVTNNTTNILYITKSSITGALSTALSDHKDLTITAHGGIYAAGSTVVAATNANSATYAVTANNSSNLAGLAASLYVTNGGAPTLYLATGTTVSNAVADNQPVTLTQLRQATVGNIDLYFTCIGTTAFTNYITPTNATYLMQLGVINDTCLRTNTSAGAGNYITANIYTNQSYTTFPAQSIGVQKWCCESVAGSMYIKEEIYRYQISDGTFSEWGEGAASNLVTAGSTPTLLQWSVPVTAIVTNEPFYLATRTKHVAGTASALITGTGSNYPSLVTFTVPSTVLTQGLASIAYVDAATNGRVAQANFADVSRVASNLNASFWDVNSTNTIIGNDPGSNSIGSANTFLGKQAAKGAFALSESVFVGELAGYAAPSNTYCVFVGKEAGREMNSTAGLSVGVGYQSLKTSVGQKNTMVGEQAGFLLNGIENEGFGLGTMASAVGSYNSIYGNLAGTALQGSYNVAVGRANIYPLIGDYNTAIGNGCLRYCTNYWSTAIGAGAAMYMSGISNVAIGANAMTNWIGSNAVCIGAAVQPVGDNSITLGNTSVTNTTIRGTIWGNGAGITGATIKDPSYAQLTNGWDYSTASFVTNGAYGYLSLTNLVPASTRGVYIRVLFTPVAAGSSIWFMPGADYDAWSSGQQAIRGQVASVALEQHLMITCTNQAIRYTTTSGGVVNVSMKVMHYWE